MPFTYHIDHDRRVVMAQADAAVTAAELLDYQRTVWSDPGVAGYDELVDMTSVTEILPYSPSGIKDFAAAAAQTDALTLSSRLAIVAPGDLAFGMARMYQAYREVSQGATKQVTVFRDREAAMQWLGLA